MDKRKLALFAKDFKLERYLIDNKIAYKSTLSDNPQAILKDCPFCKSVNYKGNYHPNRFYIAIESKLFLCHNCGEKGALYSFLAKIEGLTFYQIVEKYIHKNFFEALPEILIPIIEEYEKSLLSGEEEILSIELPNEFVKLLPFNPKYKKAYNYIKNRGFLDKDSLEYLDLRYCDHYEIEKEKSDGTKYKLTIADRIIFPISFKGEMVGWQGRDITGESPVKYYISEGMKKNRIIYNYEKVFDAEEIIIVEGMIDLIKCKSYNPILLFGKHISKAQIQLLHKMPNLKRIVLGLDPDTKILDIKSNKVPFDETAGALKDFWDIYELNIPNDKDLGDMSFEEVDNIISNKKPYTRNSLVISL